MSANSILMQTLLDPKFSPQMNWAKLYPEFFIYELDFGALADGASSTLSLNIQADASFLITDIAGTIFDANTQTASQGIIQVQNAAILITDSGSGKNLMNAAVPFHHLFGQGGQNRFTLPVPRIVQNNATISVTLTNNNGAAFAGAKISFLGAKILNRSM